MFRYRVEVNFAEEHFCEVYLPLFHNKKRRKLVYGSRNSAKSHWAAQYSVIRLLRGNTRGVGVRKVFESIKESQYNTMKEIINEYELDHLFKLYLSPLKIECVNGSYMTFLGLDKPTKAKSIKDPNYAWYEEADELTEEDFEQTSLSIRGENVEEVLTTNAPPETHWLVSRLFTEDYRAHERVDGMHTTMPSRFDDWLIYHTCWKHNEFIDAESVKKLLRLKEYNHDQYLISGLGLIGTEQTGSEYIDNFSRKNTVKAMEYDPDHQIHASYDQNRLPHSTQIVVQLERVEDNYEIRVIDEICLKPPANSTEQLCQEHRSRGYKSPFVYGDASGSNKTQKLMTADALNHYQVIFAFFGNDDMGRVIKKNPPRASSRRVFRRLLSGYYGHTLYIDPKCVNLITDFEKLQTGADGGYVKKKVKDKKTGATYEPHGHAFDALVYMIYALFPEWFTDR